MAYMGLRDDLRVYLRYGKEVHGTWHVWGPGSRDEGVGMRGWQMLHTVVDPQAPSKCIGILLRNSYGGDVSMPTCSYNFRGV